MFRSTISKKIRNFLGLRPSYFLIDFRKNNHSISDAFFWRTDNHFSTTFNFSDLLNIFFDIKGSNIDIIFFDKFGQFLKIIEFKDINYSKNLIIDKKLMNNIEDYGTFFIFHNTSSNFKSIIRNSCYTGYSYKNNLPSFVHGNLCSAMKDLENNKISYDIIGKSFFKTNKYFVQNYINSKKTEILIMNPTNNNLDLLINNQKYTLKTRNSRLIEVKSKIIEIESDCYLIRPIIFSYENTYLDVYHG